MSWARITKQIAIKYSSLSILKAINTWTIQFKPYNYAGDSLNKKKADPHIHIDIASLFIMQINKILGAQRTHVQCCKNNYKSKKINFCKRKII